MSYNFCFDRPDERVIKIIKEKEEEIEELERKLQGGDKAKDIQICDMIRNVLLSGPDAEKTEKLTAALVNMRMVMEEK